MYYEIAPKIVDKINALQNADEIYKSVWKDYLAPCMRALEFGNNLECKRIYVDMVKTLQARFL